MKKEHTYTLEELAQDFDLTPRTARHYIEKILPPHHKKGRGKLARYGQDTWNCFAFIKKVREQSGFTAAQLAETLATLDQAQIDRVAMGLEDLRVVTSSSVPDFISGPEFKDSVSESARFMRGPPVMESRSVFSMGPEKSSKRKQTFLGRLMEKDEKQEPPWPEIYADDRLRISYRGKANRSQREQVKIAAKLIKKILSDDG